jgi:hypothetical protein
MKTSTTREGGGGRETTTQTNTPDKKYREGGRGKKKMVLIRRQLRASILSLHVNIFIPNKKNDFNFFSVLLFLFWGYISGEGE